MISIFTPKQCIGKLGVCCNLRRPTNETGIIQLRFERSKEVQEWLQSVVSNKICKYSETENGYLRAKRKKKFIHVVRIPGAHIFPPNRIDLTHIYSNGTSQFKQAAQYE